MRIRYDGNGHILHAFGKVVLRGDTEDFSKAEVTSLQAQAPHIRVAVVSDRPSTNGSRKQWVTYAEENGVTVTDGMTRDQVIRAVDGATDAQPSGEGELEAHAGAEHHDPPKEN